jgi:hypothetical protein
MTGLELVAISGEISYDAQVTNAELWRAVGRELVAARLRMGLEHASDVEGVGGPTNKTVSRIEKGQIGRTDKLAEYTSALGLSLADVLRAVLVTDHALSPEAELIVRKFERATVEGRQALLATAAVLPERAREG